MDILYLQQNCFIQHNVYVCRHRLTTPPSCFYPHPKCSVTVKDETLPKIRLLNPYQLLVSQLDEEMTVGPFYLQTDHTYAVYSATKVVLKNITILASALLWQFHVETLSMSQLEINDKIITETQSGWHKFFIQSTTNSTLLGAIIVVLSCLSLILCCRKKKYQECSQDDSRQAKLHRVRIKPEMNNLHRIKRLGTQ